MQYIFIYILYTVYRIYCTVNLYFLRYLITSRYEILRNRLNILISISLKTKKKHLLFFLLNHFFFIDGISEVTMANENAQISRLSPISQIG